MQEQERLLPEQTALADNHNNEFSTESPNNDSRFRPWRDPRYLFGIGCIVFSLLAFTFGLPKNNLTNFLDGGSFWLCHAITIIFWAVMTFTKKAQTRWFDTKIDYTLQLTVLLQIGAFALNAMTMEVFPPSVLWLQIALTVHCAALLAFSFRDFLPKNALYALFFIMGFGFVLDFYFFALTLPIGILGIALIWFFGMTVYGIAPLIKIIYEIIFLVKTNAFDPIFKHFFFSGIFVAIAAAGLFNAGWFNLVNKTNRALGDTNNPLPSWVRIAQVLPPSVLTEKLLKSEVPTIDNSLFLNFQRLGERLHDPLMIIANWWKPIPRLEDNDRANALRAIFDARSQAEQRLWSGDDVVVEGVKTTIELHPEHRLAYTEKVINIKNTDKNIARWATQEAIFTFRLPEGGVVTSSSLWVDGKEREAFLTTRGKADSAYRAVVGVEMRDPSVVHWQEGNAVTVRVFPCTPELPRQFKLGFTTPLRKVSDKLVYENITFDGVLAENADDELTLNYNGKINNTEGTTFSSKNGKLVASADAMSSWACVVPCPPLSTSVFSFDNKTYQVAEMTPQYETFDAQEIYLDINAAWTEQDFDRIKKLNPTDALMVFVDGKKIRFRNDEALFDNLRDKNFSIFPIHLIENPENALVITKNKPFSPDFTALKGSRFAEEMSKTLPKAAPIRVFCLDNQMSTYWHTLQQMRVVHAIGGSFDDLLTVFSDKKFLKNTETSTKLNIPTANISIEELTTSASQIEKTSQNDHLLRLFAYNKILASIGKHYFDKTYELKPLVDLAEKGYVVSPVSSLIVLETDEDYERFGIKKGDKKSLGNAILQNAATKKLGAAPEPHEWLLMGLALGIILFFLKKQNDNA